MSILPLYHDGRPEDHPASPESAIEQHHNWFMLSFNDNVQVITSNVQNHPQNVMLTSETIKVDYVSALW